MTRTILIAAVTAAAALATALAALPAAAQTTGSIAAGALSRPAPVLKRSVTVRDGLVRIGDLLDNAGTLANVPVFRAPDIGTTGTVSTAQVLAALRPHDLFRVDTAGLEEIEVSRPGRLIAAADIEASIVQTLATQYRLGDPKALTVTFDRDPRALTVEPSAATDIQIARAYYEARSGRFDVTAEVPGSALAKQAGLRFTGTLMQMVDVPVLTRAVARGEILRPGDVAFERRPKSAGVTDAVGASDPVAGLAARQALRAGAVLRRLDVAKPELVKRDDLVSLIYEVPGILLTTRAKALESGAEGDVVSVINIQSKRTVQGIVTGNGQVTLVTAAPRPMTTAMRTEQTGEAPARE